MLVNKKVPVVERFYSNSDFNTLIGPIINNKIEDLVNNVTKVNTATSQISKKGHEIL